MTQAGLSAARIEAAVEDAGLERLADGVAARFSAYYELLQRWNAKLNLTAIRDPEEVLQRHFAECIFCAQRLPSEIATLLDYGSGAGFPGIPIALCRPEIRVTLAESQEKKASFLREAARLLEVTVEVYSGRVEEMPTARIFDAVTLRAVDKMREAVASAVFRVGERGWLVLLANAETAELPPGFVCSDAPEFSATRVPGTENRFLLLASKSGSHEDVPHGTIRA